MSCLLFVCFQEKDYVGFATLPNQVHRKSVKKGFDFTLLVAGTKLSIFIFFYKTGEKDLLAYGVGAGLIKTAVLELTPLSRCCCWDV